MVTTRRGPAGHSALCHVMEEVNIAFGNATILRRQTVEMTAAK